MKYGNLPLFVSLYPPPFMTYLTVFKHVIYIQLEPHQCYDFCMNHQPELGNSKGKKPITFVLIFAYHALPS